MWIDLSYRGLIFSVKHERDAHADPPWEQDDGHGIVSEWTTRDMVPGERILSRDRGSHRYYDMTASLAKAKAEGWGLAPEKAKGLTKKQIIAAAVEADFEYLRAWCDDEWEYIGVIVTLKAAPIRYEESLWGIESNAGDYLDAVAKQLADQIIAAAPEQITADIARLQTLRVQLQEAQDAP